MKGFTLVEVLVGVAVFGLLTAVIASVFVVAHRYTRLYQQVSQVQREAVQCVQAMTRELRRSQSESLQPPSAVNATWILSNTPPESNAAPVEFEPVTGQILWQKWVGIWCQANGDVDAGEIALSGGSTPYSEALLATAPATITAFTGLVRRRRLASSVASFEVRRDGRLLTVEVTGQTNKVGDPATRYSMQSSILAE